MKKLFTHIFILGLLFTAGNTLATVGGPTFIHTFKYNPADESVYYILNSESGRGCPPVLMKMSLNSGKAQTVFSCDQGEKLMGSDYSSGHLVNIEINKIIENFKSLTPINLKDNRISVTISFVDYKNIAPDVPEIKNANFFASIYQDNKKVADFPISGCNLEQPFVFAGYAIPGFDKKIILLLSTKGDCWEGGYIYESLHIVGGVSNLDKIYLSNFYKEPSALVPNEGTLVVFESEGISKDVETLEENSKNNSKTIYTIIAAVFGLGLGYFLGRKVKN